MVVVAPFLLALQTATAAPTTASPATQLTPPGFDPMMYPGLVAGAVVLVIASVGTLIVQVLNAWAAAKERIIAATQRTQLQATTQALTQKAQEADVKLTEIKNTSDQSAKAVNGNLNEVRADLARQIAHSAALQGTVNTLVDVIKTMQRGGRATDPTAPVHIVVPTPVAGGDKNSGGGSSTPAPATS